MIGTKLKKLLAGTMITALFLTQLPATSIFLKEQRVLAADNTIQVTGNYTFDKSSTWDTNNGKENNLSITTDTIPQAGATLKMDIFLSVTSANESKLNFTGQLKAVGIMRVGNNWAWVQSNDIPALTASDFSSKVTVGSNTYYKASVSIEFGDTVGANVNGAWNGSVPFTSAVTDVVKAITIQFAGYQCDYKGDISVANVVFDKTGKTNSVYVNSTKTATGASNQLSLKNQTLYSQTKTGEEKTTTLATTISLVDPNATADTKAVYSYLQSVGNSDSVLFGHQDDTWQKAGSSSLSNSDTKDVTGSIPGVVGIDGLSLTGNEYSAAKYNATYHDQSFPQTPAGNVAAAAALTNKNIADGAVITLSVHMPNFSVVNTNSAYNAQTDPSYAKYDFSGYTPNTLTGDPMNQILPGGQYNEKFNAYLDLVADYASQVNGTILFRPFHENTGSWFWWGAAFCDAATYRNVYKYTVDYLRDVKQIHNILYVYGPSSEAASTQEYGERYPGDDYVDIVGFDMYHSAPADNDTWFDSFSKELSVVQDFATAHNKLITVTETGVANSTDSGDNQTALHKSKNQHLDWYNEMLNAVSTSKASYFLLWANFSEKDGFYTPYVKSVNADGSLYGHEELDYFIDFFNDPRSIFAVNQKQVLQTLPNAFAIQANPTTQEATGYFTAPVSGARILDQTTITANVKQTKTAQSVQFVCSDTSGNTVTLNAQSNDNKSYQAILTADQLKTLQPSVGTIRLLIGNTAADEIKATFNIKEAVDDPYEIDGFENYYGIDSLLTKKWATNKATGSTITIGLSNVNGTFYDGSYGLKFDYKETSDGWAGATISKETNWSNCNALQFYTIPDGKNQKVVIQVTANATVYEAYLNDYSAYTNTTRPMLVTIPFSKFVQRDTAGHPAGGLLNDKSKITSFGLWVNAIAGSSAIDTTTNTVSGTIYYDKITAVSSDASEVTFATLN